MTSLFNSKEEHDACGVGFVVHTMGKRSNDVLFKSRVMLERMHHRGACACDETTGDGAGVMTGIPTELYSRFAREANVDLPDLGTFAVGMLFVNENIIASTVVDEFKKLAEQLGLRLLFWRIADVNRQAIGRLARLKEPAILQVFVVEGGHTSGAVKTTESDYLPLKLRVYLLRKYASHCLKETCYVCCLSTETVVYKGMFTPTQLWNYYTDLSNPDYLTHFSLVHNRFSTNTLPSWCRAHPQRMLAHNGEINTLRGNVNFCRSRQSLMQSLHFSKESLAKLMPIIEAEMSDSGCLDNLMEFLFQAGDYTLPEVVMMMIPEAWHNVQPGPESMSQALLDFYKWAANSLEPWDGPGKVTRLLDRNVFPPARIANPTSLHGVVFPTMASEFSPV